MQRRELLKNIVAITAVGATPIIVKGEEVGKQIKISKDKYIVLFSVFEQQKTVIEFAKTVPLPEGTPLFIVHDIDNAIRIFEL